jgi:hypothetical protein
MKRLRLSRRTLKRILAGLVVLLAAGGLFGVPWLNGLQQKSPETFATIRASFKDFRWMEAARLARALDALTAEEAKALRYRQWRERIEADPNLELETRKSETKKREESGQERGEGHRLAQDLLTGQAAKEQAGRPAVFALREPWKLSVALRDQCRKFLEIEWRGAATTGARAGVSDAAGKCAYWVPLSDDEQVVFQALAGLRDKMDYANYLLLLDALKISSQEVLGFEERLRRMADSFSPT